MPSTTELSWNGGDPDDADVDYTVLLDPFTPPTTKLCQTTLTACDVGLLQRGPVGTTYPLVDHYAALAAAGAKAGADKDPRSTPGKRRTTASSSLGASWTSSRSRRRILYSFSLRDPSRRW